MLRAREGPAVLARGTRGHAERVRERPRGRARGHAGTRAHTRTLIAQSALTRSVLCVCAMVGGRMGMGPVLEDLGIVRVSDSVIGVPGDRRLRGISGGERKRVSIASEILHKPKVRCASVHQARS